MFYFFFLLVMPFECIVYPPYISWIMIYIMD